MVGLSAIALHSCQPLSTEQFSLEQLVAPSYESQLADYLANTGATMYGAYWCPHCARQKQLFNQAAQQVPYVECDARGVNTQVDLCHAVGITAYPTWEIRGEFYLGTQPLKELAILSGFEQSPAPERIENDAWGGFSPAP
ncbi:glutaredoxin family protein [Leptothoe sp. PORK10 BA2]|uniref:glutaredoxin family protein n=1 Tax=Leptothoe sp. PORK10 BA2 TaxID=3110254 RepID=UPI002B1F9855|nr:hypothetical protein [Leptothoe sp. PORK10 BA2]MEA5464157.1 hypothetical protein [Leptothoe sp. PORK10 BA2]